MPPKHHAPSQSDLDALIGSYLRGDDYYVVGRALGMARRTINANIQRFEEEGRMTVDTPGSPHPKEAGRRVGKM